MPKERKLLVISKSDDKEDNNSELIKSHESKDTQSKLTKLPLEILSKIIEKLTISESMYLAQLHSKLFDAVNITPKVQYLKLFNLFSNNSLHSNLIIQNGISYENFNLKKDYIEAVIKQKKEMDVIYEEWSKYSFSNNKKNWDIISKVDDTLKNKFKYLRCQPITVENFIKIEKFLDEIHVILINEIKNRHLRRYVTNHLFLSSRSLTRFPIKKIYELDENYYKNLKKIDLDNNSLVGIIPRNFNLFTSLEYLNLSNNNISGPIPEDFFKLKITTLDLSLNNLSGQISINFSDMPYLRILNLSVNHLRGLTPNAIINMSNLRELNLSNNCLDLPVNYDKNKYLTINYSNQKQPTDRFKI